jgi:hypothetical protein
MTRLGGVGGRTVSPARAPFAMTGDGLTWFYVSLPRGTFALGVRDGIVVAGPPYMRRQIALGRDWASLAEAWRRAGRRRPGLGKVIIQPLPAAGDCR